MNTEKFTCVVCPIGCEVTVKGQKDNIEKITGFKCDRGKKYAKNEFLNPTRILTSTVKIKNHDLPVISVRTDKPVSKDEIFDCMKIIRNTEIEAPITMNEVIIKDINNTGVNIITTKK
ncbi:DUF1667 domain-containing protein [Halanaerobium sp.]|uniref:DUF1667 domain-containing protein n=1 Tax=Halanaerobium sp. TaxID=1895664 RepID=UPI000DE5DE32|nr:DUF1667 domain-containing protein [Halanaerobium sp.]PUU87236.1 MAG: hypothetical protein CI949_3681 [Halanaerobium sp.]